MRAVTKNHTTLLRFFIPFITIFSLHAAAPAQKTSPESVIAENKKKLAAAVAAASQEPTDVKSVDAASTDLFEQAPSSLDSEDEPTLDLTEENQQPEAAPVTHQEGLKTINAIYPIGNTQVLDGAILNSIPYRVGEQFDPQKTGTLIRNLYQKLRRFRNIRVYVHPVKKDAIDLYIVVEEKKALNEVIIKNNKNVSEKDILEKLNLGDTPAVDEKELPMFIKHIKKMYQEKGFHNAEVVTELKDNNDGTADAIFTITEGKKSLVKRICFTGNKAVSSKKLRSIIYTREDWILSFMDNAGSYDPERTEYGDKAMIEQYYQNKGYLNAKVVDIDVYIHEKSKEMTITFEIKEGDLYTIDEVHAPGNDLLTEEQLLSCIPVRKGDLYSREAIVDSIKNLETIWGDFGHIYAHIDPSIQPNPETKTVNITFYTELGNKVFLNKINIIGNRKTRDKVIRRKLLLREGRLLTNRFMDESKNRVEALGYFDPKGGVNWKVTRLNEELADLDLMVKEVNTGSAHLKFGFGGAAKGSSPLSGISVGAILADTNLFGRGINFNLEGKLGAEEKSVNFSLLQPALFDRNVLGGFDCYHKRTSYDELRNTRIVNEKLTGGYLTTGIVRRIYSYDTQFLFRLGFDSVRYEHRQDERTAKADVSRSHGDATVANLEYQKILNRNFEEGDYAWFSSEINQNYVNHPMHPSRGYRWSAIYRLGVPAGHGTIGFHKFLVDANWFTPLIGERDLVLRLHGHFGIVEPLGHAHTTPYRELFHIGGASSVRGFQYGEIGPRFLGDSIGGKKGFFVNAELIFPITSDFSMKGVIFYDGGAGWDNPFFCEALENSIDKEATKRRFANNSFDYRHSVGIGIRLLNPAPIKIDWGFKIDPRKKLKESAQEVHFGMSYDF